MSQTLNSRTRVIGRASPALRVPQSQIWQHGRRMSLFYNGDLRVLDWSDINDLLNTKD